MERLIGNSWTWKLETGQIKSTIWFYLKYFFKLGLLVVLASSSIIGPGILAIWLFDPALLKESSVAKLVLLSLSFMLPVVILNSLSLMSACEITAKIDIDPFMGCWVGCFVTLFQSIVSLTVCYFLQYRLHALYLLMSAIVIMLIVIFARRVPEELIAEH